MIAVADIGFVVALVNRTVLTIDYRDFRLYRPVHCAAFTLLPEPHG